MQHWPFEDSEDTAVITLRQIMQGKMAILYVSHDDEDGMWQFLGLEALRTEDAVIVALAEIINRNPAITELADLPLGWHAWRNAVEQSWTREPNFNDSNYSKG